MAGLVPAIHAAPPRQTFQEGAGDPAWMAGTSPAMTRAPCVRSMAVPVNPAGYQSRERRRAWSLRRFAFARFERGQGLGEYAVLFGVGWIRRVLYARVIFKKTIRRILFAQ